MEKFSINRFKFSVIVFIMVLALHSCKVAKDLNVEVYETSEQGNSLTKISEFSNSVNPVIVSIKSDEKFQTITGFGGSFTEASAHLLNKLSVANRKK